MIQLLNEFNLTAPYHNASTGQKGWVADGKMMNITSPVDGATIGKINLATPAAYKKIIRTAQKAFPIWRQLPAPKRGEIIRQFGEALREKKEALGKLVSYEMGKSLQEGYGLSLIHI